VSGTHRGLTAKGAGRDPVGLLRRLLVTALLRENRPARLDLTFYPYLPAATVGATDPRAYLGLIANAGSMPATAGGSV